MTVPWEKPPRISRRWPRPFSSRSASSQPDTSSNDSWKVFGSGPGIPREMYQWAPPGGRVSGARGVTPRSRRCGSSTSSSGLRSYSLVPRPCSKTSAPAGSPVGGRTTCTSASVPVMRAPTLPGWHAGAVSENDPSREAAAQAALERIAPGMTIGLGSGRAVWRLIELIGARPPAGQPLRAAFASNRTRALAEAAGIEAVELDGATTLDLAIDGADEIDPQLGLIKGGGAALLREKIVVTAAARFLVVAETRKRVARLGETFKLPVEVVRFGWRDTRRRL